MIINKDENSRLHNLSINDIFPQSSIPYFRSDENIMTDTSKMRIRIKIIYQLMTILHFGNSLTKNPYLIDIRIVLLLKTNHV